MPSPVQKISKKEGISLLSFVLFFHATSSCCVSRHLYPVFSFSNSRPNQMRLIAVVLLLVGLSTVMPIRTPYMHNINREQAKRIWAIPWRVCCLCLIGPDYQVNIFVLWNYVILQVAASSIFLMLKNNFQKWRALTLRSADLLRHWSIPRRSRTKISNRLT